MGTARQGTLRLVIHSQNLEMGLRLYIIFAIAIGVVAAQRKRYSDYDVNYRPRHGPDSRDYDDDELDEELNFIGGKVQTIEQKLEREIREHPPNRRRRAKYRDFFKHVMNIFEKGVKFVPMISQILDKLSKNGSKDDVVVGADESTKSAKSAKAAEYDPNVDDDDAAVVEDESVKSAKLAKTKPAESFE